MDFLGTPFLFFATGLFFATTISFLESMFFGEFEGVGSALAVAAIGAFGFVSAHSLILFLGFDSLSGVLAATGFALVAWTVAFQFSYEYSIPRSFLYATIIWVFTTATAFGVPYAFVRFGGMS